MDAPLFAKEKAREYYPKLWSRERLEALVKAGRLTETDLAQLTGEEMPKLDTTKKE